MLRSYWWFVGLGVALVSTACLAERDGNESARVRVDPNGLHRKDICDGPKCEGTSSSGGGDGEDPPDAGEDAAPDAAPDGGADGGKEVAPWDEPPIDTFEDPKSGIDLLPIAHEKTYCPRNKEGDVVVNIRNIGTSASGATKTRVTFAMVGDVIVDTGPLAPGAIAQHHVPIPPGCFSGGGGDCEIVIKADAHLDVGETNESNNEVIDVCPGWGL